MHLKNTLKKINLLNECDFYDSNQLKLLNALTIFLSRTISLKSTLHYVFLPV